MTQEEIAKLFEGAPEGATHYLPGRLCPWYRQKDGGWNYWTGWKWCCAGPCSSTVEAMVVARNPVVWNGEGLPPVGTVCEYNAMPLGKPKKWHVVEVVYSSDWFIVLRCISAPEGHSDSEGVEISIDVLSDYKQDIRPIRTPEQIAAQEREAAIKEIGNLLASVGPTFRDQATRLYDAGLRLPEGGAKVKS